jgi:hypothetical protein
MAQELERALCAQAAAETELVRAQRERDSAVAECQRMQHDKVCGISTLSMYVSARSTIATWRHYHYCTSIDVMPLWAKTTACMGVRTCVHTDMHTLMSFCVFRTCFVASRSGIRAPTNSQPMVM